MLGENLTLGIVIAAALVDSINPCVLGVLIFLIAFMNKVFKTRMMMLWGGLLYSLVVYLTYLALGFGILRVAVSIGVANSFYTIVAAIAILAGLLEIKDYFWYGKGFSLHIPAKFAKQMNDKASKTTVPGVIALGAFVSAVELPCTGAPYLAILALLSQYFDFTAVLLLVLYNILFVSPLIVILLMVATGTKLYKVKKWKQESRGAMRLAIGLLLVGMGWLLMLIANGTINFG